MSYSPGAESSRTKTIEYMSGKIDVIATQQTVLNFISNIRSGIYKVREKSDRQRVGYAFKYYGKPKEYKTDYANYIFVFFPDVNKTEYGVGETYTTLDAHHTSQLFEYVDDKPVEWNQEFELFMNIVENKYRLPYAVPIIVGTKQNKSDSS